MILSTMPWLKVSSIENENLKLKLLHDFLVRSFIRNLGWEVWALTNIVDEEAHSVRGGLKTGTTTKTVDVKLEFSIIILWFNYYKMCWVSSHKVNIFNKILIGSICSQICFWTLLSEEKECKKRILSKKKEKQAEVKDMSRKKKGTNHSPSTLTIFSSSLKNATKTETAKFKITQSLTIISTPSHNILHCIQQFNTFSTSLKKNLNKIIDGRPRLRWDFWI